MAPLLPSGFLHSLPLPLPFFTSPLLVAFYTPSPLGSVIPPEAFIGRKTCCLKDPHPTFRKPPDYRSHGKGGLVKSASLPVTFRRAFLENEARCPPSVFRDDNIPPVSPGGRALLCLSTPSAVGTEGVDMSKEGVGLVNVINGIHSRHCEAVAFLARGYLRSRRRYVGHHINP
ncbi:hypothetical protein GW17_00009040 [Ensete ventricosum]|nr:hypothetical protein GW17_00009040 [Ensete ventricosum]